MYTHMASKMPQWALASKPDNLSLIPGTYIVEGEK